MMSKSSGSGLKHTEKSFCSAHAGVLKVIDKPASTGPMSTQEIPSASVQLYQATAGKTSTSGYS